MYVAPVKLSIKVSCQINSFDYSHKWLNMLKYFGLT